MSEILENRGVHLFYIIHESPSQMCFIRDSYRFLVGIFVAPFFLSIWFLHGRPVAATKDLLSMPFDEAARLMWRTAAIWLKGADIKDNVKTTAWIIEGIWFVFIAGWGAWKGVKSYKRGAISRWRERRRIRKAERRAWKAEQRAARESAKRANAQNQ